jgi:hypothetical protein
MVIVDAHTSRVSPEHKDEAGKLVISIGRTVAFWVILSVISVRLTRLRSRATSTVDLEGHLVAMSVGRLQIIVSMESAR